MKKMSTKMMETLAEKVDRNNYKEYREKEMQAGGYFEQIAYNRNVYGCTAQLFKGTKTGTLVYTTDIYAVSF